MALRERVVNVPTGGGRKHSDCYFDINTSDSSTLLKARRASDAETHLKSVERGRQTDANVRKLKALNASLMNRLQETESILSTNLTELEREIDVRDQSILRLKEEKDSAAKELSRLLMLNQNASQLSRSALENRSAELRATQQELMRLRSEFSEQEKLHEELQVKYRSLLVEKSDLIAEVQKQSLFIQQAKENVESLETQKETLLRLNSNLINRIKSADAFLKQSQKESALQRQEVCDLNNYAESLQDDKAKLHGRIQELSNQLSEVENEKQNQNADLVRLNDQVEQTSAELNKLRCVSDAKLKEARNQAEALSRELTEMQKSASSASEVELRKKMENLRAERDEWKVRAEDEERETSAARHAFMVKVLLLERARKTEQSKHKTEVESMNMEIQKLREQLLGKHKALAHTDQKLLEMDSKYRQLALVQLAQRDSFCYPDSNEKNADENNATTENLADIQKMKLSALQLESAKVKAEYEKVVYELQQAPKEMQLRVSSTQSEIMRLESLLQKDQLEHAREEDCLMAKLCDLNLELPSTINSRARDSVASEDTYSTRHASIVSDATSVSDYTQLQSQLEELMVRHQARAVHIQGLINAELRSLVEFRRTESVKVQKRVSRCAQLSERLEILSSREAELRNFQRSFSEPSGNSTAMANQEVDELMRELTHVRSVFMDMVREQELLENGLLFARNALQQKRMEFLRLQCERDETESDHERRSLEYQRQLEEAHKHIEEMESRFKKLSVHVDKIRDEKLAAESVLPNVEFVDDSSSSPSLLSPHNDRTKGGHHGMNSLLQHSRLRESVARLQNIRTMIEAQRTEVLDDVAELRVVSSTLHESAERFQPSSEVPMPRKVCFALEGNSERFFGGGHQRLMPNHLPAVHPGSHARIDELNVFENEELAHIVRAEMIQRRKEANARQRGGNTNGLRLFDALRKVFK